MDDSREYIALSLLSHANYCMRRAALIWNERIWIENEYTAKGRAEHENVHRQRIERRGKHIKLFEYEVVSEEHALIGKCDCIECKKDNKGCTIPSIDFPVSLYPVEFKHGKVREELEYHVQLCAQAMCLEEMFGTQINDGAIYFITSHKRSPVVFTPELREIVVKTSLVLRKIRSEFITPQPYYSAKCKRCSLNDYCQPLVKPSAKNYCKALKDEAIGEIEL